MFISEYFKLSDDQLSKMNELGIFDALLDKDSNFFINILRLRSSMIPEFKEAYKRFNDYFSDIAILLESADDPIMSDKMYRAARNKFRFHEVNGINLGFASSRYGAGWGDKISDQCLKDAYQIVKKGCKQPEIFHLVSLFEENVAGDRLSDMIATIIEPDIVNYTIRMMKELDINSVNNPDVLFLKNGLAQNPYKKAPVLMLPIDVLHELPIAKGWDDIDKVILDNETIRRELSSEIGEEWYRRSASERKDYIKRRIFMDPDACKRIIDGYKGESLDAYSPCDNLDYLSELVLSKIKKQVSFKCPTPNPSSYDAALSIIRIFKHWVENCRGWDDIQSAPSKKREKAVQRFIYLGALYYIKVNNIDLSLEPNNGRGPVDIKSSRGNDKTLLEVKLSSNGQYLHGYQEQVQEYGKAERTRNLIYVLVDVGNPERVKRISELHNKNKDESNPCPELIIINAVPKNAASTYDSKNDDYSFEAVLNWDIDTKFDVEIEDWDLDFGNLKLD